jgi:hypothetical protein
MDPTHSSPLAASTLNAVTYFFLSRASLRLTGSDELGKLAQLVTYTGRKELAQLEAAASISEPFEDGSPGRSANRGEDHDKSGMTPPAADDSSPPRSKAERIMWYPKKVEQDPE